MNLVGRGSLLGAFVGAVGGFLLGGGPSLIHHFLPHVAFHGKGVYPWPVDVMMTGSGGLMMFLLPGACLGGLAGMVMQRLQSRQSQKPMPQPVESDAQTWPPAPQPPNPNDVTE